MKSSTRKHLVATPNDKDYERAGELFEAFTAGGLTPAPRVGKICCLLGKKKKCCKDGGVFCLRMPAEDHVRGFKDRTTGELVLTHHPYFSVRKADGEVWGLCDAREGEIVIADGIYRDKPLTIPEFTALCEGFAKELGLTVKISMDSWYWPGRTLLVEYRKEAA
jgi:hypothetical protein